MYYFPCLFHAKTNKGANPQIIHRDLKPSNLLVGFLALVYSQNKIDEHWNVKVCDFGLSQVKLRDQKIRDGKSIPGTPLWMAPEVSLMNPCLRYQGTHWKRSR